MCSCSFEKVFPLTVKVSYLLLYLVFHLEANGGRDDIPAFPPRFDTHLYPLDESLLPWVFASKLNAKLIFLGVSLEPLFDDGIIQSPLLLLLLLLRRIESCC